jgi:hypothetical protein
MNTGLSSQVNVSRYQSPTYVDSQLGELDTDPDAVPFVHSLTTPVTTLEATALGLPAAGLLGRQTLLGICRWPLQAAFGEPSLTWPGSAFRVVDLRASAF